MATFSNNTTIKMASGGSASTSGSKFTTTSGQYAIVTVSVVAGPASISIGATTISLPGSYALNYYIPPSTNFTVGGTSGNVITSWVIFENTP